MFAIRPWLYVGGFRDISDAALLATHQIRAMLQLDDFVDQPGIATFYLPINDGALIPPRTWRAGVQFVRERPATARPVLVACGAGHSRSVAFIAAVLKEEEGGTLRATYRALKHRYTPANVHPLLWQSLCDYYGEATPFLAVLDVLDGRDPPDPAE